MTNAEIDTAVISDCRVKSLDSSINIVSNVADSAWGNDTPCTDWNVKDVVSHIVHENVWMVSLFNGRTIEEVGDDPIGTYNRTAGEVKAILAQPDAMSRTCQISWRPVTGAEYSKQLFLDTLIHGWDIAVGSDQDAKLDDYLVQMCTPLVQVIAGTQSYRSVFAGPTSGSNSDNAQTKLLALLRRNV